MAPSRGTTVLLLSANIVLSITIVLLNKWIYVHIGFPNITMTLIHFLCTFLGLVCCRWYGLFTFKVVPLLKLLPLAFSFCGFVVFTNLSLQTNTVETYQIIKSLTMPCIFAIQTYFYKSSPSLKIVLTLIPLILGVFLNSCFDLNFNVLGTFYALIGVAVTSVYQIWVGEKQKEFQVNFMQLLYFQAPLSAFILFIAILYFEPPWQLFGHTFTFLQLFMVLLSGVVAFLVNLFIYWIIGTTSAVTYNVLGQLKFSLTVIGGYFLFQDPIQIAQCFGIVLTFTGVILYTHFKVIENAKATTTLPLTIKS